MCAPSHDILTEAVPLYDSIVRETEEDIELVPDVSLSHVISKCPWLKHKRKAVSTTVPKAKRALKEKVKEEVKEKAKTQAPKEMKIQSFF